MGIMPKANDKGAHKPLHPCDLIMFFVIFMMIEKLNVALSYILMYIIWFVFVAV